MSFWHEIKDEEVKSGLKNANRDGFFWSIMIGAGESFIHPFAIALKATNLEIATLSSLPQLLSSMFDPLFVRITDRLKSRRPIVVASAILQALMWIPLFSLPFMMQTRAIPLLILIFTLYLLLARAPAPAWISWMGDLVPKRLRGRYWSHRSIILFSTILGSTFLAGQVLGLFENTNEMLGFAIIFGIAMVARLVSAAFLARQEEPTYVQPETHEQFSLPQFIRRLPSSTYGRFVLFNVALLFGVRIAAPFFAVYMLRDLNLSYPIYTLITVSATAAKVVTLRSWGRLGDRFGNRMVLIATAIIIPVVPLLWLFSAEVWYLILIELVSGFVWAGYDLSSSNYLFDAVKPKKRGRVYGFHRMMLDIMVFVGAMVGGFLATKVDVLPGLISNLQTIFLISALVRFIPVIFILPSIKEVRKVEPISTKKMLIASILPEPTQLMAVTAFYGVRKGVERVSRRGVIASQRSVNTVYKNLKAVKKNFKGKKAQCRLIRT